MTLQEAITLRHSVRSYVESPIPENVADILREKIAVCNALGGLSIRLITNEPKAFRGFASYGKFTGVENYLVMAGRKSETFYNNVGYYGQQLVLLAQTLGLNTCWAGQTYKKINSVLCQERGEKTACLIALGYGASQGVAHKSRKVEDVSNCTADSPEWMRRGVEAALLAPTAVNQQRFRFIMRQQRIDGRQVVAARRGFSLVGYTRIDLGIAKLHFEIGAGTENFMWEES